MSGECAHCRARTGFAPGVGDLGAEEHSQPRFDERPSAHVLRFFLAPDELRAVWKWLKHFAEPFLSEWIKLLNANERCIFDLALGAVLQEIVIHFARAEDDPLHFVGGARLGRAENFFEPAMH